VQLIAQIAIISAPGSIAHARTIRLDATAAPPLADIKQGLKMRDRFRLAAGITFLTAGPS
jgi:hypothetical protein